MVGHDQHKENVPALADLLFNRSVAFANRQGQRLTSLPKWAAQFLHVAQFSPKQHALHMVQTDTLRANLIWYRTTDCYEFRYFCEIIPFPVRSVENATEGSDIDSDFDALAADDLKYLPAPSDTDVVVYKNITALDGMLSEALVSRLRENILEGTRVKELLFAPNRLPVALHLRRGRDVSARMNSARYTPDEYYYNLVARIRLVYPDADVHVFSSMENHTRAGSFRGYLSRGMQVHLEDTVGVELAWVHMVHAKILVTAKSSFSLIPALLNPNCIIFEPRDGIHGLGMAHWVTEAIVDETYLRNCQ